MAYRQLKDLYKLAPHVTEQDLIDNGFSKCDEFFTAHAELHFHIMFNLVSKDTKTYTEWIGIVLKKQKYDIEKNETTYYRTNKVIKYRKNKRKNYSGYMHDIDTKEISSDDTIIKELIEKGIVVEIEKL